MAHAASITHQMLLPAEPLNLELIRRRQYSGERIVRPHRPTAILQPTRRRNPLTCFLLPLRSLIPDHLPHLPLHASRVCSRYTRPFLQTTKVHLNTSRLPKALNQCRRTAMIQDNLNLDFVRSILEYPTESLYLGVQVREATALVTTANNHVSTAFLLEKIFLCSVFKQRKTIESYHLHQQHTIHTKDGWLPRSQHTPRQKST